MSNSVRELEVLGKKVVTKTYMKCVSYLKYLNGDNKFRTLHIVNSYGESSISFKIDPSSSRSYISDNGVTLKDYLNSLSVLDVLELFEDICSMQVGHIDNEVWIKF